MIVKYSYYKDTFKGDKVPQEEFEKIEVKASSQTIKFIVNRDYTNWNGQDYTEQVQMATCSIIDILYDIEKKKEHLNSISNNTSKVITAEKVDDYSKNYATVTYKELQEQVSNENTNKLIKEELENQLWYTGLFNRSVKYV